MPIIDIPYFKIEFIIMISLFLIFINRKLWFSINFYPIFKEFYLSSEEINDRESFKKIWKKYVDISRKIDFEVNTNKINNSKLYQLFISKKIYQDSILINYVLINNIVKRKFKKMERFHAKEPSDWSYLSIKSIYYSFLKIFFKYGLSYNIQKHNDKKFLDETISSLEINENLKLLIYRTHASGFGNDSTISLLNVISIYLRISENKREIIDKKLDFSIDYDFGWLHRRIFEVILVLSIFCKNGKIKNEYFRELNQKLKKLEPELKNLEKKVKYQFIIKKEELMTNFRNEFLKPIIEKMDLEYA
jgi:hypothetical protein